MCLSGINEVLALIRVALIGAAGRILWLTCVNVIAWKVYVKFIESNSRNRWMLRLPICHLFLGTELYLV